MSTTHDRNEQINIVVSKDQKVRWKEYLELNGAEFQSLSHLIRQAVEKEVRDDSQHRDENQMAVQDNSEILEAIGRLDEKLQGFETRLASIEKGVRHDPDVREVANRLFEQLPTKDELLQYEESVAEAGAQPPNDVVPRRKSGRIEDLVTSLDEPQHRVREGLERLKQDTHQVHTMTHDGDTRYYKEG